MTITSLPRNRRVGDRSTTLRGRRRAEAFLLESLEVRQLLSGTQPIADQVVDRPDPGAAEVLSVPNEAPTAQTSDQTVPSTSISQSSQSDAGTALNRSVGAFQAIAIVTGSPLAGQWASTGWLVSSSLGSSSYSVGTSAYNDASASTASAAESLISSRISSAINRILTGLLAARGFDSVVVSTPSLMRSYSIVSTPSSSGTDDDSISVVAARSSSTVSTSAVFATSTVQIIVIPVGTSRVVLVLPVVTQTSSLVASASEPVQQKVPVSTELFTPTPRVLDRFGQTESMLSTMSGRRPRLNTPFDMSGMIDIVAPYREARATAVRDYVPSQAADAVIAAVFAPFQWPLGLSTGGGSSVDVGGTDQFDGSGSEVSRSSQSRPVEAELSGLSPRLAAVGVLAGAAYSVALKEARVRGRGLRKSAPGRHFTPELRRQILPGR